MNGTACEGGRAGAGVCRVFLTAKSHELITFKKEKERSILDRMGESMQNIATKMILKDKDPRYRPPPLPTVE